MPPRTKVLMRCRRVQTGTPGGQGRSGRHRGRHVAGDPQTVERRGRGAMGTAYRRTGGSGDKQGRGKSSGGRLELES